MSELTGSERVEGVARYSDHFQVSRSTLGIGVPSSLNLKEEEKAASSIDHLAQDSFSMFFALAPGCQEPMKPICQAVDFVHTFCGPCTHLVDRIGERFQGISEDHSGSAVRREEKGLLRLSGWICQQMTSTPRGSMVSKVSKDVLRSSWVKKFPSPSRIFWGVWFPQGSSLWWSGEARWFLGSLRFQGSLTKSLILSVPKTGSASPGTGGERGSLR